MAVFYYPQLTRVIVFRVAIIFFCFAIMKSSRILLITKLSNDLSDITQSIIGKRLPTDAVTVRVNRSQLSLTNIFLQTVTGVIAVGFHQILVTFALFTECCGACF
ncbi:Uncharacterised protein [Yersinia enterocolitica]|nr:Uncharacterised protein [Yersinia enterocolitica]